MVIDLDLLQVPEGVITGGQDDVAKYGGLAEYTLNVDTQKLGLWPGGFLNVIAMSGYGQSVNKASGALVSADVIGILPAARRRERHRAHEPHLHAVSEQVLRTVRGEAVRAQWGRQRVCS